MASPRILLPTLILGAGSFCFMLLLLRPERGEVSDAPAAVIVERDAQGQTQLRFRPRGQEASHSPPPPHQSSSQMGVSGHADDAHQPINETEETLALMSAQERERRARQSLPVDPRIEQPSEEAEASRSSPAARGEQADNSGHNPEDNQPWSVELFPWGPALTVREGIFGFGLHQDHFPDGVAEVANVSGGLYRMQFEGDASAVLVDGEALDPERPSVLLGEEGRTITFAEPVGVILVPVDDWQDDELEPPSDSG